jgi:hypothetical protein
MPTKTTDRSEALDRTSAPVGNMVTELGGGVIPEGSCRPVEVEVALLTPGACVVESALGCPLLVGPMLEMAVDEDVVSVALIDELTEGLTIVEEEIAIRLELDEDTTVPVLATGNGTFVTDADREPAMDVLKEVVVSLSSCTVDDPLSGSTLLLFAGIGNGIATCVEVSVPLITCAKASKQCTSVKAIVRLMKSDIIVLTCSNDTDRDSC